MSKIREERRVSMNAVRMEESVFLIAEDYMKQVIRLGRAFSAVGGITSSMMNNAIQVAAQYMTQGAALMNLVKTAPDCGQLRTKRTPLRVEGEG